MNLNSAIYNINTKIQYKNLGIYCCGSRACKGLSPPLPLSLSLYSVAHIVNKQYVTRAARYDEPQNFSLPSRGVDASQRPPTDL